MSSSGLHHRGGDSAALRHLYTLALVDSVQQPTHGFESCNLQIDFLSLSVNEFLPPVRGAHTGSIAVQEMANLVQPEAARLRQSKYCHPVNCVLGVPALTVDPHSLGQHANFLPITDC